LRRFGGVKRGLKRPRSTGRKGEKIRAIFGERRQGRSEKRNA